MPLLYERKETPEEITIKFKHLKPLIYLYITLLTLNILSYIMLTITTHLYTALLFFSSCILTLIIVAPTLISLRKQYPEIKKAREEGRCTEFHSPNTHTIIIKKKETLANKTEEHKYHIFFSEGLKLQANIPPPASL